MTFIWPQMLLALLAVPLGVAGYRALEARRRRRLAAAGGFGLPTAARRDPAGLRRRIPAALVVLGFAVLAVALARPQATLALPREEGTVILAFDVSGSMAAADVAPTRLDAARTAAEAFVGTAPSSVAIGVVAFSDSGLSVQRPTADHDTALAAMKRLVPQKGTSVAQGILAALDAITVSTRGPDYYTSASPGPTPQPTPVPAGTHAPAVIVLLTDGENNESPDPVAAAKAAADQGVRIYTVGLGSTAGTTLDLNGFRVHTQLDAGALEQIAELTDGAYFAASSTDDLHAVYDTLGSRLVVSPESIEVTSLFAGAGVVLLTLGALASLVWLGRLT